MLDSVTSKQQLHSDVFPSCHYVYSPFKCLHYEVVQTSTVVKRATSATEEAFP
jgi:hypothetical protein